MLEVLRRVPHLANRKSPPWSDELTRIAAGILQQIVLVLGFGLPEVTRRYDFGDDFARPQTGFVNISDRIFGNLALLVRRIENRRSIARADVVALAVACAWIVDLEEKFQDLSIPNLRRIKEYLDGFGMGTVVAIGRIWRIFRLYIRRG